MPRYLILSTHLEAVPHSAKFLRAANFMKKNFAKANFCVLLSPAIVILNKILFHGEKFHGCLKKHEIYSP